MMAPLTQIYLINLINFNYFINSKLSHTCIHPLHSPLYFIFFPSREKVREIEQMAIPLLLWLLLCLLAPTFISSSPVQDPELVVEEVHKYIFIEKPHFSILITVLHLFYLTVYSNLIVVYIGMVLTILCYIISLFQFVIQKHQCV